MKVTRPDVHIEVSYEEAGILREALIRHLLGSALPELARAKVAGMVTILERKALGND